MEEPDVISLAETGATCEVDLQRGGRVAQVVVQGQPLLIDPGPESDRDPQSTDWGSYPMAPWAGRVRHGRFIFFDRQHQLRPNVDGGHAMHGTVFSRRWTLDDRSTNTVSMSCRLDQPDSGWSFPGTAHQTIELLDGQLRCDLSIEIDHHAHSDRDPVVFPGEIGWHPWFVKPDRLVFHPNAMYARDDVGLPTGRLVSPPAGPWDDCFVNTAPVTLEYDRPTAAMITISSDCDHWVVYDMPDHATCVEPQSGPPDAFTIRPQLVTATHPLRHTMIISW